MSSLDKEIKFMENTPVFTIAEDVVKTVLNPTPEQIVQDTMDAIGLIKQLMPLVKTHPHLSTLVKWVF